MLLYFAGVVGAILLFFLYFITHLTNEEVLSINLKRISSRKYKIVQKLNSHPLFTKGEVKFFVTLSWWEVINPNTVLAYISLLPSYPKTVFITPIGFFNRHFDVIIAHELGHLEYGHIGKSVQGEIEATCFAARVIGIEKVKKAVVELKLLYENAITNALQQLS